jgi:hypothetical protein
MTLEVGKGEGPSTGLGSSMRAISGSDRDFAKRPSVEGPLEKLKRALDHYSPTTIFDITRQIDEARKRVGDDPVKIADLLEEGARARTDAGKALREGDITIQQIAEVIRGSTKTVN